MCYEVTLPPSLPPSMSYSGHDPLARTVGLHNNNNTSHGNDINNSTAYCLPYLCIPSTNIPLTANQCLPTPHIDLSASDHPSAIPTIPAADNNDHHNNTANQDNPYLPARHLHLPFIGIPQPLAMIKPHILHHWIPSLLISPLHHPTNADSEQLKFITKLKHRPKKLFAAEKS